MAEPEEIGRFAENANTLLRFSKGHGGIACEACHGSTHAIWPNATDGANDNEAVKNLQGYAGTLIECSACHAAGSLSNRTDGPHGLHAVNEAGWYDDGHEEAYEADPDSCGPAMAWTWREPRWRRCPPPGA